MKSFDIYIRKSLSAPYWYVEYEPPAWSEQSGLSIETSFKDCLSTAKDLIKMCQFNHLVVVNQSYALDIYDDIEVVRSILTHS